MKLGEALDQAKAKAQVEVDAARAALATAEAELAVLEGHAQKFGAFLAEEVHSVHDQLARGFEEFKSLLGKLGL